MNNEHPRVASIDWERWAPWLILLLGFVAYANSFSAVFVLDDMRWIVDYPPIQHLWPPTAYLLGNSRPLVNLSLAINYAISGLHPWSYHLFNLAIHLLAGLTLYGIVRRILLTERLALRFGRAAVPLALSVATLWLVHPLQTESVTYVIQRAESMMGLFYLLTLYGAIRGGRWQVVSVAACLAGMLTKPIMLTAPFMVILYDWAFLSTRRWKFYGMLALTWLGLLWALQSGANDWERSAGFGFQKVTAWQYTLTQPAVILQYLKLSIWPVPLCLDYGWPVGINIGALIVVIGLLVLSVFVLSWKRELGFVCAWFWVILAPSSSFIPVNDLAFEHRMYLSLIAVVILLVLLGWRFLPQGRMIACVAVIAALMTGTSLRNADYSSALAIWQQTVKCAPHNARAHQNLGKAFEEDQQPALALAEYKEAVRLDPSDARTRYNLGTLLAQQGLLDAAITEFRGAIQVSPGYAEAHYNLGMALRQKGQTAEAQEQFQVAAQIEPRLKRP